MIFRAEISIPTVVLGAFRSRTGEKAHLARGPGQKTLCSDKRGQQAVGDFLKSEEVEFIRSKGSGRIQICVNCRSMLQMSKVLEANLKIDSVV